MEGTIKELTPYLSPNIFVLPKWKNTQLDFSCCSEKYFVFECQYRIKEDGKFKKGFKNDERWISYKQFSISANTAQMFLIVQKFE